jgi:integrase/recombinase XerD
VIGKDRLKNPRREENRVNMLKLAFGSKLLSSSIPENKAEREQYLTLDTIDAWVVKRRQADIRAGSINRDVKPVKWILDYAIKQRYIKENPMNDFERIKGERIHDRWMTQEEVDTLVAAAYDLKDDELVHFISIAVNTGFRLDNLIRLSARDIHWTTSKEDIEQGKFGLIEARQTKSDQPYTVPITPAIEPLLRRLCQQRPIDRLLKCGQISQRFRDAARKAKLYKDKDDNDRVTIHTLRHTFAVLYLKRGGDVYKLSKLLGHASVAITDKIYARFCPKDKEAQAPMMSTPIAGIEQPKFNVI